MLGRSVECSSHTYSTGRPGSGCPLLGILPALPLTRTGGGGRKSYSSDCGGGLQGHGADRPADDQLPVVRTSSTRTDPGGGCVAKRNAGCRLLGPLPAWRAHQNCGRRAHTTGMPRRSRSSSARNTAGSTPYRTRRRMARGTGTSAVACVGTPASIAPARMAPAAPSPWYLRRWTRRRAADSCTKPLLTFSPPARVVRPAGRSVASQSQHRRCRSHVEQDMHIGIAPTYRNAVTRQRVTPTH